MSNYLRRHHLGLIAIFIALSGTAIAATDPIGSDGDVDACFNKKRQLILAKGDECKKGSKPVSWSQTGPAGARGATGPAGTAGATGPAGAAGSARAYGLVQASGFLTNSKNASVTKAGTGIYCVSVPGVPDSESVIQLTTDYNGTSNGIANLHATDQTSDDPIDGGSSRNLVALWDPVANTCPANQFEVQTAKQEIDTNSSTLTALTLTDAGFAFVVP